MGRMMFRKKELLERIERAHRQLERYIFYFEKDGQGKFSASKRHKFSREKMLEPGVYGIWSLKDLLANVIRWENLAAVMLTRERVEYPEDLPEPGTAWESTLKADHAPLEIVMMEIDEVLSAFPGSFENLYGRVNSLSEEELFEVGFYASSGERTAADYAGYLTITLYDWTKGLVRKWRGGDSGGQLNKRAILERIRTERRRLEGNLQRISRQDMVKNDVVGKWSVKDLLAHLVEWERMFMGWYEAGRRGVTPEIPAPGYTWSEMDALNERIYLKYRDRPLEDVLVDFEDSYQKVYKLVEGIPEEEIFAVGSYKWVGKGNLVSYILANTANHYRWAKEKVRAWLKEKGEI